MFERIRPDEGQALETSSFEFLVGGQFTLSTQLINASFCVSLPHGHDSFFLTHPLFKLLRS